MSERKEKPQEPNVGNVCNRGYQRELIDLGNEPGQLYDDIAKETKDWRGLYRKLTVQYKALRLDNQRLEGRYIDLLEQFVDVKKKYNELNAKSQKHAEEKLGATVGQEKTVGRPNRDAESGRGEKLQETSGGNNDATSIDKQAEENTGICEGPEKPIGRRTRSGGYRRLDKPPRELRRRIEQMLRYHEHDTERDYVEIVRGREFVVEISLCGQVTVWKRQSC